MEVSSDELIELLFKLQDDEYLSFVPFPDGTIRVSKVGELEAKGDISRLNCISSLMTTIYQISNFWPSLNIGMEFDKCMAVESTVEKFKKWKSKN